MNQKERERRERELAAKESKARAESQDRQEEIKAFWDFKEQNPKAKTFEERQLKEKKLKLEKLEKLRADLVRNLPANVFESDLIDRVRELVELAGLQDREIQYLIQFRRDWERILAYYPEQLENLSSQSHAAELSKFLPAILAAQRKALPKDKYERTRRRWRRGDKGEIERQFGRDTNAVPTSSALSPLLLPVPYPTGCLDEIFCGRGVNMLRLEELFGIDADRFPKLRVPQGRQKLYRYRDVTKIMHSLLSEERPKPNRRGRPLQTWLSGPDLRARVLSGIEARINGLSVPEQIKPEIKRKFLKVVRRHLHDSAEK